MCSNSVNGSNHYILGGAYETNKAVSNTRLLMAKPKWSDAVREQREGPAPEPEVKEKPGRCKCGSSEFKLSAKEIKGKLTRTCKCGDKVHF